MLCIRRIFRNNLIVQSHQRLASLYFSSSPLDWLVLRYCLYNSPTNFASVISYSRIIPLARHIAQMAGNEAVKPLIRIDVTSDTVCPWCFVGKRYLEKAMDVSKDRYNFEVKWHPFLLNPNADTTGIDKTEYYKKKFGEERTAVIMELLTKVFQELGMSFKQGGLTGSTLDSHRLIELAGRQGLDKQNALVEELFLNYFTQEKYIGDRNVLREAASKAGVVGAEEWLNEPYAGIKEVQQDLQKYAQGVTGVPNFLINGRQQLSGAQPPEAFLKVFELVSM